ncbi:MAG: MCP four helix bundle domain-containing protein [Magnetococcales bacterium]|nr:MCP four helix bundle domain-containing protein [Magnetococcales bacterium]MBF0113816.1 MCP four helix bundle domain-containing protein [Magnetococcales bacterium]
MAKPWLVSAKFLAVRMRLVTGMRVLVLLMVVLGVIGIVQMVQLASLTEQLYRHPFQVNTATLRVADQVTRMHGLLERVDFLRSIADLEKLLQELDGRHAAVLQDLKLIEERFLGDKQRVINAQQILAEWMRVREKLIALKQAGDPDKLRHFSSMARDDTALVQRLEQEVGEIATFASRRAQLFMQEAQNTRDRTIGLAVAILLFCFLLSLWLSRAIQLPLQNVVNMLSSAASQMAASINQQERIANQQATALNETTTTMEELDASSRQSAEQAGRAASGAQQAVELAQQGMLRVDETLQSMVVAQDRVEEIARRSRVLSEQTGEIRSITEMVTDFANETRMLAVNAAVEAVRAGEHGKGFAVLAVETRKLADESKQSASRIQGLIHEIRRATDGTVAATDAGNRAVEEGISSSHNTVESFRGVAQAVEGTMQGAQQISLNVRQQSVAIRQVTEAVQAINMGARESAAGMQQIKGGVQMLNDAAQSLKKML